MPCFVTTKSAAEATRRRVEGPYRGKTYDLDFFMKESDPGGQVTEITIHKENAKARYVWAEEKGSGSGGRSELGTFKKKDLTRSPAHPTI